MYNKMVIGIDESYTRTGIAIALDGKLIKVTSLDFKGLKNNSEKRKLISNTINRILTKNLSKAKETIIICERIRTLSPKGGSKDFGIRPNYLISTGALIGTIIDTAYEFNVPVYSADTRSWKTQVIGTNKTDAKYHKEIKPEKMAAIEFIQALGFDLKEYDKDGAVNKSIRGKNKGKIKYNDDAADAGCIALYGFLPANKQKLNLEL